MQEIKSSLAETPANASLDASQRPSQRILVADDDIPVLRLHVTLLSSSGYHVQAAEDGVAAWEALVAEKYDLLLTDNTMPRMTGIELIKKVHEARMALKVVMVTGTPPEEEFVKSPWFKPAAILLKPYSIDALLGTVEKALSAENGYERKSVV